MITSIRWLRLPLTALLAATIVMRRRQSRPSGGGNLEARHGVVLGGGVSTNGRGSLPVEALWKDQSPE